MTKNELEKLFEKGEEKFQKLILNRIIAIINQDENFKNKILKIIYGLFQNCIDELYALLNKKANINYNRFVEIFNESFKKLFPEEEQFEKLIASKFIKIIPNEEIYKEKIKKNLDIPNELSKVVDLMKEELVFNQHNLEQPTILNYILNYRIDLILKNEKIFSKVISSKFVETSNQDERELEIFLEDCIEDFKKLFYTNTWEIYDPFIFHNMFVAMGIAVSDKITFFIGHDSCDARSSPIYCGPTGSGKGRFHNAIEYCSKHLEKKISIVGGAGHQETYLGSLKPAIFKPEENLSRCEKVSNVTFDENSYRFIENFKSYGMFYNDVIINPEASNILDKKKINQTNQQIFGYFCNSLEPIPKGFVSKPITGANLLLTYKTHCTVILFLQNQKLHQDFYDQGMMRRLTPFQLPKLKLTSFEKNQDNYKDNKLLRPKFFLDVLVSMKDKSNNLAFIKEDAPYTFMSDEWKNKKGEVQTCKVRIYNPDDWSIKEYSNIKFTPNAINLIQYYVDFFYNKKIDYKIYLEHFREKSESAIKDMFKRFAFLLQIAYQTYKKNNSPNELIVDEWAIHLIAPRVQKLTESMFIHFSSNYTIKDALNLQEDETMMIKILAQEGAYSIATGLDHNKALETFCLNTLSSKGTFQKVMKGLIREEYVIPFDTGKRTKGNTGKIFYLNENKIY